MTLDEELEAERIAYEQQEIEDAQCEQQEQYMNDYTQGE